jgi:hypothetical protein
MGDTTTNCPLRGRFGVFLTPWDAVTQMTEQAHPHPPSGTDSAPAVPVPVPVAAARASAAAGAAAAGLALAALTAVVLLLWIASPFPDSGLDGALHFGTGLWLLAQGADLVRTRTLSGVPAPIGITPLLLSALPAWLLHRGAASAVANGTYRCAGWVLGGYLSVAAGVTAYAAGGRVHVDVLSAALHVPLFAVAATAAGAWSGCGRPPLTRYVPWGADAAVALRAGAVGTGVLVGGGALIGGAALAWHAGAAGHAFGQLSAPLSGQAAVLLLCLLLVPDLAVWSAAYALGPGFAVGAGSAVAPAGASGYPLLPGFPLLAALPGQGGAHVVGWATLALPALAGGAVALCCARAALSVGRTALVAAGASAVCGLALALLAAAAGGPMGVGTLASFGPSWWLTGAAALAWTLAVGLPAAVVTRWLQSRAPGRPGFFRRKGAGFVLGLAARCRRGLVLGLAARCRRGFVLGLAARCRRGLVLGLAACWWRRRPAAVPPPPAYPPTPPSPPTAPPP